MTGRTGIVGGIKMTFPKVVMTRRTKTEKIKRTRVAGIWRRRMRGMMGVWRMRRTAAKSPSHSQIKEHSHERPAPAAPAPGLLVSIFHMSRGKIKKGLAV